MEPQLLLWHGNIERFCIADDMWPNCGQRIVQFVWQLWSCGRATMLRALLILFLSSSSSSSVICQTTGPKPFPKRFLHIVWSRASSFNWQSPLLSLRSSSSFLCLLSRLPVTSIPLFYLSFNNPLWKAVSTQNVTNQVSLPFTYFM